MAKNDNLTDFLKGLADKFRSVLGTADPLNPQEFEDKIQTVRDEAYSQGFAEGGPTGITATAPDVLSGKVFGSGGSAKATGTMPDRGSVSHPTKYQATDGAHLYIWVPYGYCSNYDSNGHLIEQPFGSVASAIGLTAAKIMKGNTILGVAGSGVSTPAQIGVKPFLKTDFDFYVADKGEISAGKAPCNGNLRLWFTLLSGGYTEGVEYLKSGTRKVSGKTWNFGDSHYYIDIATKKGEAISFKFKSYGNNSKGYLYFLYYTSVS